MSEKKYKGGLISAAVVQCWRAVHVPVEKDFKGNVTVCINMA